MMTATGAVRAAELAQRAEQPNRLITCAVSGRGELLTLVGFGTTLAPFRVLADVVPPFGSIVGVWAGLPVGAALFRLLRRAAIARTARA